MTANIVAYRYSDERSAEIKLQLPQGESFILADKVDEDHYDVSVILPWIANYYVSKVDGMLIWERMHAEAWKELFKGPTSDLVAIIREALPTIKKAGHAADLYMEY